MRATSQADLLRRVLERLGLRPYFYFRHNSEKLGVSFGCGSYGTEWDATSDPENVFVEILAMAAMELAERRRTGRAGLELAGVDDPSRILTKEDP